MYTGHLPPAINISCNIVGKILRPESQKWQLYGLTRPAFTIRCSDKFHLPEVPVGRLHCSQVKLARCTSFTAAPFRLLVLTLSKYIYAQTYILLKASHLSCLYWPCLSQKVWHTPCGRLCRYDRHLHTHRVRFFSIYCGCVLADGWIVRLLSLSLALWSSVCVFLYLPVRASACRFVETMAKNDIWYNRDHVESIASLIEIIYDSEARVSSYYSRTYGILPVLRSSDLALSLISSQESCHRCIRAIDQTFCIRQVITYLESYNRSLAILKTNFSIS